MKPEHLIIRGELYVTLKTLAECYQLEVHWLHEVYDTGLLGPGETECGELAIAACMFDRLAQIVRLHRQVGVNLEGIVLLLGSLGHSSGHSSRSFAPHSRQ